jgi:hypothetical protein
MAWAGEGRQLYSTNLRTVFKTGPFDLVKRNRPSCFFASLRLRGISLQGGKMTDSEILRKHVADVLGGGEAHAHFDQAVADFPIRLLGTKPPGSPHTAWQLVEHLRLAQWDILEFSRDPRHVSPEFPEGYWPDTDAPPDSTAWRKSVAAFQADLKAMQKLVTDPEIDILARVKHPEAKEKHTVLREALLLADHNAYHVGQLVLLRRLLGAWE